MMPSEGTQQASLDSFFKRKNPQVEPYSRSGNNAIIDLTDSPPNKKIKLNDDNNQKNRSMTQTSSSYFKGHPTARPLSVYKEPARKPSTTIRAYKLPHVIPSQLSRSGSAFETCSLVPQASFVPDSQPEPSASPTPQRTTEQLSRHEEWTTRILAMSGSFRRRRSLALDEAAAAEVREAAGLEDEGTFFDGSDGDDYKGESEKNAEEVGKQLKKYVAKELAGKAKSKGKKKEEIGPSGLAYTPLEKQFMEIKEQNRDVLLLMEVGYKYKFHGEDAKTASRELGIVAFPNRNFFTASIPTHRLHIHVKKLLSLGYKVGVITQTETAALKKIGDNRNAPFTRKLTHLFTAATYVEDPSLSSSSSSSSARFDDPVIPGTAPPPTNALVAIMEQPVDRASDDRVKVGLVCVVPGTGDITWDEFDDSQIRAELETRLAHLSPAELLLPKQKLSKATEKVLTYFAGEPKYQGRNAVRIERIDDIPEYHAAFDFLTNFYHDKGYKATTSKRDENDEQHLMIEGNKQRSLQPKLSQDEADTLLDDEIYLASGVSSSKAILTLVDFPKQVVISMAVAIRYMKRFGLENAFRHTSSFVRFANRSHMLLSSNTLANLEIYQNQTDGGLYGSLMWLLDHCKTRMGKRLLREWVGRPLLDVVALKARADAIEEIMENNSYHMEKLRSLLINMPDLVRGLTRVQYGKATPNELATLLITLVRLASEFKPNMGNVFRSHLLNNIPNTLPTILDTSQRFLNALNLKQARENDVANLWADPDRFPDIQDVKDCISVCEMELNEHLMELRKILKKPTLKYITVSGIEYLVEVPIRDTKIVPAQWVKISATRTVNRYHTPEILTITKERTQHQEKLSIVAREAFAAFQSEVAEYHDLVVVSKQIAVIDCLMSLAQTAAASGYCKPRFVAEPELKIVAGRHPMVEMLREEAYVPFDIHFSKEEGTTKIITGPNMAGKSSTVRAMALIVCMAQIGSFVPAASVILSVHDSVQTRMGASDEIGRGKSTFMVELSETSDILRTVTPRSLVILDELGRGTSTYDGVAIAYATLSHIAEIGCNTLFVTHYPTVAQDLAREKPDKISNWHMSFDEIKMPDGGAEITFLYQLTRGLQEASFGVWCARLAGLPKPILDIAQMRSSSLKAETQERLRGTIARRVGRVLHDMLENQTSPSQMLRNVEMLHKSLSLSSIPFSQ
ncbi:DNA mismatch repair protein MSH3 [Cryptococcus neoformans Ze90-1]|nr:DNA mismatch repair protein MSH3 [Cryptococcus neoformans var. grubii Ze90-1]